MILLLFFRFLYLFSKFNNCVDDDSKKYRANDYTVT